MLPDLNPIDNFWSEISRGLNNMDVAELTQAVVDIWRAILDQKLSILVVSMPRRLRAVYNARGGHTKY